MMHLRLGPRKRPRRPASLWLGVLSATWVLVAGCPSRFDPRAETLAGLQEARATDPAIDAAWREARARYDAADFTAARAGFASLRVRSPAIAAASSLWEARSDLALGDAVAARALVEPLAAPGAPEATVAPARFLLGLTLARLGEAARAVELLRPLETTIVDGDDAVELHAALASALAARRDVPGALAELERFYAGARPAERAFVREQASQLGAALSEDAARALFSSVGSGSLARAVLGGRLAARVADPAGATSLREEARQARERFGFPPSEVAGAPAGTPLLARSVGIVLPLSGKSRLVGERALRGALLGAGVLPSATGQGSTAMGNGAAAMVELLVRDSASRPERAAAAVDELASLGAAFVVLSPDRTEAAAAAARAEALGIPAFDLSLDEGGASPGRFRLLRPNAARATALAARALATGARRVATLYPDSAYGRRMAEAFVVAAQAGGATVIAQLHYDEKSTTFIAPAKKLAELGPDAVFVPAAAGQLELISAQLATLGVTRTIASRRGATLYATADGAGPRMLANAARYLEAAVLAPVFFSGVRDDGSSPTGAAGMDAYKAAFGEEPGAADALGFDAVSVATEAIGRLPPDSLEAPAGRRALAQLVSSGALRPEGLTGAIVFSPDGQRAGTPRLWTIEAEHVKVLQ